MSDTKPMAEWIYENVERDLDKKRDDDPNSVTESVVEQCFLTWLNMAKYYPDFMNIKLENPKAFIDKLIQDYKTKEDFLKPVGFCYQDDRIEPWLNLEKPNIDCGSTGIDTTITSAPKNTGRRILYGPWTGTPTTYLMSWPIPRWTSRSTVADL